MTEAQRITALLIGLATVTCALVGGWGRSRPLPAMDQDQPVIGRRASEVNVPAEAFEHIQKTPPEEVARRRQDSRLARTVGRVPDAVWSSDQWKRLVIHPLVGPLPDTQMEEGVPWHLVLRVDGSLEVTQRLLKGRPGAPPGLPPRVAPAGLHLMVPHLLASSDERKRALHDALAWLRRRLKMKAEQVVLASEIPGAQAAPLPAGVARSDLIPADTER